MSRTSASTATPGTGSTVEVERRAIWQATGMAAAGAAVANLAIALIARAADVSLEVTQLGADQREQIPVAMFAVASVIGALVGGGLAQGLARRQGAQRTFLVVGVIGTVLSMASPIAADADGGTKAVLAITHVVAAAVILPLLARRLRR